MLAAPFVFDHACDRCPASRAAALCFACSQRPTRTTPQVANAMGYDAIRPVTNSASGAEVPALRALAEMIGTSGSTKPATEIIFRSERFRTLSSLAL